MKKRILSFLCAAVLTLSLLPVPVLASERAAVFSDTQTHWAKPYISQAAELQVLNGVSDTRFAPDESMTRAMFVTAIGRLAKRHNAQPSGSGKTGFSDVPQEAWYAPYVSWAEENGIVTGVSKTAFNGDGRVTREQMCAIVYRLLTLLHRVPDEASGYGRTFTDDAEISAYAKPAVSLMARMELVCGYPDGSFAPKASVTRAETAKVLCLLEAYLAQAEQSAQPVKQTGGSHHTSGSGSSGGSSGSGGETKRSYTVRFLKNAGDDRVSGMPDAQSVDAGGRADEPKNAPTREGYTFLAWLDEAGAVFDFSAAINADTKLCAAWTRQMPETAGQQAAYLFEQDSDAYRLDEDTGLIYYPNMLDVFLTDAFSGETAREIADAVDGKIVGQLTGAIPFLQLLVHQADTASIQKLADELMERDDVLYASCDVPMQLEADEADRNPWPDKRNQPEKDRGNEENPGGTDWWAEAIYAYTGWKYAQYASSVKVGVIDEGFDTKHKDIEDAYSFLPEYSEYNKDLHGTHVAGIIAARNNDIAIRGVADFIGSGDLICADWGYRNDPNNFLDTGDYVNIIERMLDAGVKVINCSFGMNLASGRALDAKAATIRQQATLAATMIASLLNHGREDFLIVQAAGNGYKNWPHKAYDARYNGHFASITPEIAASVCAKFPGLSYDDIREHVIIVSGVNEKRNPDGSYTLNKSFSYGENVDICAPGVGIRSLNNDGAFSGCNTLDGTSMSAPMVTGAAALVWGINPSLTAREVRALLLEKTITYAVDYQKRDGVLRKYPMLAVAFAAKVAYNTRTTTPEPPAETGSAELRFVDAKTGDPIAIDTLFGENAFVALIHDSLPDEAFGGFMSEAGEEGGFRVSDDGMALVFENLPALSGYRVIFDAAAAAYHLPEESTRGYAISANQTTQIQLALTPIDLTVGDVRVTTKNASDILEDGTASFSYKTGTLTLDGASITADVPVSADMRIEINLPDGTTSVLQSTKAADVISAPMVIVSGDIKSAKPATLHLIGTGAGTPEKPTYGIHSDNWQGISNICVEISNVRHAIRNDNGGFLYFSYCHVSCRGDYGKAIWTTGGEITIDSSEITIESTWSEPTDPLLFGLTHTGYSSLGWVGILMLQTEKDGPPVKFSHDNIRDDAPNNRYIGSADGPTTYLHIYVAE